MDSAPIVTLLSDFGSRDGYVGAMKGVILSLCRDAHIIDISHDLPACDVFAAALALQTAAASFPTATIHLAVVDPGVGGDRRPLLIEAAGATFVGPDNGLLSLAATAPRRIYHLDRPAYFADEISPTFHGRDVFAAIVGHLAAGLGCGQLATRCESMVDLEIPEPAVQAGVCMGEIIHVDRFGNLLSSLRREHLGGCDNSLLVEVAGRRIKGISLTYSEVAVGEMVALIGSSGHLEIAVNRGSAACELGIATSSDSRVPVSVSAAAL